MHTDADRCRPPPEDRMPQHNLTRAEAQDRAGALDVHS